MSGAAAPAVQMTQFDVFLSHAWGDHTDPSRVSDRPQRAGVERLRDGLRAAGLRVFYDDGSIDEFAPLADTILEALRSSKVMVAWCSDLYLTRPACASELTTAMTWSVGSDQPRVLVVNTEADVDHLPSPLSARLVPAAPALDDGAGFDRLIANIASRCVELDGGLGDAAPRERVAWFPEQVPSSTRFTGRFRELWDLHGLLTSTALQSGKAARQGAVVSGMGGSGKSLLVLEYAHRFGPAWPGGVVFLTGHGFDHDTPDDATSSAEHARAALGSMAAIDLGIPGVESMDLAGVRDAIQRWFRDRGPVLWIVDDLADEADAAAWIAPMDDAATIFTTRVRTYDTLFEPLRLGAMSRDDARQLLTREHPPRTADQRTAADTITDRLGGLALAVDVTRCRVRSADDYVELLERLDRRTMSTLERAGQHVGLLPVDHSASVTATLQESIDDLDRHGRKMLDIGSAFDSVPLPDDTLAGIVAALDDADPFDAEDDAVDGVLDLEKHSLAGRAGRTTTIHRLVVDHHRPQSGLDRATVLDEARVVLAHALDGLVDQRELLPRRPHHELGATLDLDVDAPLDPLLTGRLMLYELLSGDPRAALRRQQRLVDRCERELGDDHPVAVHARVGLAWATEETGDRHGAIALYEGLLPDLRRVRGPDDPETLAARSNLAHAVFWAGDQPRAIALLEQQVDEHERYFGANHPDTLVSRSTLANVIGLAGEADRAVELFEQLLTDAERELGPDAPETIQFRNDAAQALFATEELDRAIEMLEGVLADRERLFGADDRSTLFTAFLLAMTAGRAGDTDRGITLHEHVLAERRRVFGSDHPDTLVSQHALARALQEAGDTTRALELFEQVVADSMERVGADHADTLAGRHSLADTYLAAGEFGVAIDRYEQLVADMGSVLGADHFTTFRTRRDLAWALDAAGETGPAIALLYELVADQERALGFDHPETEATREAVATMEADDAG